MSWWQYNEGKPDLKLDTFIGECSLRQQRARGVKLSGNVWFLTKFKPKCRVRVRYVSVYMWLSWNACAWVYLMSNERRVVLMRTVNMWCVRYSRRHGRMRLSNHNNKQPAFCTGSSFNHSVWFRNEQIVLVSTEPASFEVLFSALSTPGLIQFCDCTRHTLTQIQTHTHKGPHPHKTWIEAHTWKAVSSICSTD